MYSFLSFFGFNGPLNRQFFRSRLLKLPDKGERIQKLYDNILNELKARNVVDQAAELFSELNIVEKGVQTVTQMEWSGGKMNGGQLIVAADTLDSDDDNVDGISDPLKIIAQSRETKLVKVVKPPPSLITEADLQDIKSMEAENQAKKTENGESAGASSTQTEEESDAYKSVDTSIELEPHAINMIRMDKAFDEKCEVPKKFLPFRTTKSDVHNVEKEKLRKHGKHWEVTAATPPTMRNNAVKMIPLHESIETERQHKEKLREQMEKQAGERLEMRKKIISENMSLLPSGSALMNPNSFFQSYRQRNENAENEDESDNEHESYSDNSDDGEEPDTHGVVILVADNE